MIECGEIGSKASTPMTGFPVLAKPHPLKTQTYLAVFPEGTTLMDVVGEDADDTISITIEGEYIPREMWGRIKPKNGTAINITRFPEGRTVKKIIGVILLVIIAIYAPYLLSYMYTAFGVWGAVAAIGITLIATMAAYALIPPPSMPRMSSVEGAEFNRLNAITGTSNQAVPYGTIPMVLGECRFYPTLAANPFTEILGDQQYLRMLFDMGYGDLEISDIKIGETPIESFDDVDYEISVTPDLFTDDVFELSLADSFNPGNVVNKTTQVLTDEVSVDIVFPGGLFGVDKKGATTQANTGFNIEYRAVGSTGAWSAVAALPAADVSISTPTCIASGGVFLVRSSARKTVRIGVRWKVPQGQYDIRLTRFTTTYGAGTENSTKFDTAQVATLRSIKHTLPSTTGTLKLALRIKATDQLNGVINQLSVLGQQKIRVYDSVNEEWLPPQVTTNPAWIYHWLLTTCPGVAQLVDESRIDLPAFIAWAEDCDAKGFTVRGIIDKAIASGELYRMVLSAGRASFAMRDGMYSVLYDRDGLTPVQHFSPANTREFTGQRIFIDLPHGLRVRFQNPALNWQEDEIIVLDDGYSFNGLDARGNPSALPAAEKFETMNVPYVTEPRAAWQLARYQLAQAKFRPNIYSFVCDVEHLICTRGDLVYMNHDLTDWGVSFGIIKDVGGVGGTVSQILTAEPLIVEGQRTNLQTYSEDLLNAAWGKVNVIVTPNVAFTHISALLADKVGMNSTVSNHYMDGQVINSLPDNGIYSASIFVRQAELPRVAIQLIYKNGSGGTTEFRFEDRRIVGVAQGTGNTNAQPFIEEIAGEGFRIGIAGVNIGTGATVPRLRIFPLKECNPSNAIWSKSNLTVTEGGGGTTPLAGWTYDRMIETAGNGHVLQRTHRFVAGRRYKFRFYAKETGAGSKRWVNVLAVGSAVGLTSNHGFLFDVATGAITFTSNPQNFFQNISITTAPDSVSKLVEFEMVPPASGTTSIQIRLSNTNNTMANNYAGDGVSGMDIAAPYAWDMDSARPEYMYPSVTSNAAMSSSTGEGVYVWGGQVESGAAVTEYIPTTNAAVTVGTPLSDYSVRVRTRDGDTHISALSGLTVGENTILNLVTPMPSTVEMGDLYLIGTTAKATKQLLVTKIEPSADLNATIQAVEYDPAVQTFDDDPPTTFTSAISGTVILEPPPPPDIYAIFSDPNIVPPSDGGNWTPGINIGVGPGSSGYRNTATGWVRVVSPIIQRQFGV